MDIGHKLLVSYPDDALSRFPMLSTGILPKLCRAAGSDCPVFTLVNETLWFASFLPSSDNTEYTVIIGPFRLHLVDHFQHVLHSLSVPNLTPSDSFAAPSVYPPHILHLILMLFNSFQGTAVTDNECWQANFQTDFLSDLSHKRATANIFSNRENQKMHNTYAHEMQLLQYIENGDPEGLQQSWKQEDSQSLGTTAADPVRNGKNMAIYIITACGRAAIRAGVSAEYIFTLTDSYAQQVEELKNLLLLQTLVENAQLHFVQLVVELKNQSHNKATEPLLIRRCKDYVFRHLHDPLTVKEIAEQLQVHPNYLGTLFRREEGQTLYQYILQEKIKLVQNLLTYSDYSYLDIAHYLGFISQSHLGVRFKSITGMSLKQYRDMYQRDNF